MGLTLIIHQPFSVGAADCDQSSLYMRRFVPESENLTAALGLILDGQRLILPQKDKENYREEKSLGDWIFLKSQTSDLFFSNFYFLTSSISYTCGTLFKFSIYEH